MSVQQQISFFWLGQAKKLFPQTKVNKAVDAVGARAVELMRERTMSGKDKNGQAFAPYTWRYKAYKSWFLKSKGAGGQYAAKRVNDHIRLTGDLFRQMRYQVNQAAQFKKGSIDGAFRIYIGAGAAKKAEGLMSSTGRNKYTSYKKPARLFFGVAEGNSAQARKEKLELKKTFVKEMGFDASQVKEVGL